MPHTHTHTHTHTNTHIHKHTHTHTHASTHAHTDTYIQSFSDSLSLPLTRARTCARALTHTNTQTHTHKHTHTLSLSLSLTHTHTHARTPTHKRSLTHAHTHARDCHACRRQAKKWQLRLRRAEEERELCEQERNSVVRQYRARVSATTAAIGTLQQYISEAERVRSAPSASAANARMCVCAYAPARVRRYVRDAVRFTCLM
jgi:hypothetical protein